MPKAYHEALRPLGNLGIQVSMATLKVPHLPEVAVLIASPYALARSDGDSVLPERRCNCSCRS